MLFYHGSADIFKVFDKNRIGQNFKESALSGFFFTDNKRAAEGFVKDARGPGEDGFVFEVELEINDPVEVNLTGDYDTPVEYYDRNPDDMLREAYVEKRDGISITGRIGDALAVVFEPEQVTILKIYQQGVVVFDRADPASTLYPDILGDHVVSNANKDTKPFHYNSTDDIDENTISSGEFGKHFDDGVRAGMHEADVYSSDDGRHFGRGSEFAAMAFSMICGGVLGDGEIRRCRQDCLVIHDFDANVTMIKDLRQEKESISSIINRPLVNVEGAVKSFAPKEDRFAPRPLSQAVGPKSMVDAFIKNIPDYFEDITSVSRAKTNSPQVGKIESEGISALSTPKMR
jgi:hypothetical protein